MHITLQKELQMAKDIVESARELLSATTDSAEEKVRQARVRLGSAVDSSTSRRWSTAGSPVCSGHGRSRLGSPARDRPPQRKRAEGLKDLQFALLGNLTSRATRFLVPASPDLIQTKG